MKQVAIRYVCDTCNRGTVVPLPIQGDFVQDWPVLRCAHCPGFPVTHRYPPEVKDSNIVVPGMAVPRDVAQKGNGR